MQKWLWENKLYLAEKFYDSTVSSFLLKTHLKIGDYKKL